MEILLEILLQIKIKIFKNEIKKLFETENCDHNKYLKLLEIDNNFFEKNN